MKKIAIIERLENSGKDKPFNIVYYLDSSYRKIFDKLNILLISVISEKNIEEISNICDGLILTGSANDVYPKYYNEEPIEGKKYDKFELKLIKIGISIFILSIILVFFYIIFLRKKNSNKVLYISHKILRK